MSLSKNKKAVDAAIKVAAENLTQALAEEMVMDSVFVSNMTLSLEKLVIIQGQLIANERETLKLKTQKLNQKGKALKNIQ